MTRTLHVVNGRLRGVFYETDAGHKIYLAHRQMRHLNRHFNGWTIDNMTLRRCRDKGFHHIGVVCRRARQKHVWLSLLEDFYDRTRSFGTRSKKFGNERGIRLKFFRIDPANDSEKIDASFRIK